MLIKALEELDIEMQGKNEAYKKIHEHIEPILDDAPEHVIKSIADGKKTLAGAYKAMEEEARKRSKGSKCVVMTSEEGFKICREYFGLTDEKQSPENKKKEVVSIFDL